MFITARKRSLGQGNIFTPVCHSVHMGGGEYLGRDTPWDQVSPGNRYTPPGPGTPPRPGTPPPRGTRYTPQDQVHPPDQVHPRAVHAGRYGQQAGGTHPTGMHSCCTIFLTNDLLIFHQ